MDATMMEGTGPAALPTENASRGTQAAEHVVNALQNAGWFGLGLIAYAVEGAGWMAKQVTEKGREVAPAVAKPLKAAEGTVGEALGEVGAKLRNVGQAMGRRAEAMERAVDDRIANAAQQAGAPLMAEMGELKNRLDELSKKIEAMQGKRG